MAMDHDVIEQVKPGLLRGMRIIDIGVDEGLYGISEFALELVGPTSKEHTYILFTPGYTGPCKDEAFLAVEVLRGHDAFVKAANFPEDFNWWSTNGIEEI